MKFFCPWASRPCVLGVEALLGMGDVLGSNPGDYMGIAALGGILSLTPGFPTLKCSFLRRQTDICQGELLSAS